MDFLEAWDEATGPPGKKKRWSGSQSSSSSSSSSSSPWVSATLAVALSHPVAANSLPDGSIVVNEGAGEVVSVVAATRGEGGGGGSCSEWLVRVRAPASSFSSSSSPSSPSSSAASSSSTRPPTSRLCVSLSPRAVFDVWGAPFGAREGKSFGNCTEVRLAPRLRLFAPFAAAAAPWFVPSSAPSSGLFLSSVEAEVGASEDGRVLLLLAASEPVTGLDASSFDVAIEEGRGRGGQGTERRAAAGVVALSPVVSTAAGAATAATLWHAVLQLPAGYLGPVVVSLRTEGIRSGPRDTGAAAAAAAPAAPLALRAVAAPLLRPTGFQLLL